MAKAGGAITINFDEESVIERLNELTSGKGPEKCIDAVGMEAHATRDASIPLSTGQTGRHAGDRSTACAAGDVLCLPPGRRRLGPRRLWRTARQGPVRRRHEQGSYDPHGPDAREPLDRRPAAAIEEGQIDPSFVITHTVGLDQGPDMYETFRDKKDGCIKVVLKPN